MAIYRIADLNIKINNKYSYISTIGKDYLCESQNVEYDFEVSPDEEDIQKEKQSLAGYPEYYLESISIYRQIARKLAEYQGFIMHASVVEMDKKTYAFTAQSGTGKSTHSQLWLKAFPNRARIINGDKPIVRLIDDKLYVYGTPWSGKERFNTNTRCELNNICFLARGENNTIEKIDKSSALPLIFTQLLIPESEFEAENFFLLLNKIFDKTSFYRLHCNMDLEAAIVAYEGMNNE